MTGDAQDDPRMTLIVAGGAGALFLGVGVLLVITGDGAARLFGVGAAAMGFVAMVIAVTYGLGRLRSRSAPRRERPQPSADGTIIFPRTGDAVTNVVVAIGAGVFLTAMMAVGLVVGALALVAIAAVMWLLIVPATIQGAVRVLGDPVAVELSPAGLRTPDLGAIPWSDIERLAIEDQRPMVARPGVTVVGSMRVLAIHLRPGAEPPRQSPIDRAMRWVAKGYVAMGARAGYGRFHWLAIPERLVGVPLEEILDAASSFRGDIAGPEADAPPSVAAADMRAAEDRPPDAPAVVAGDAGLGEEADAILARFHEGAPVAEDAAEPSPARGWAIAIGGAVAGLAVGWWLGAALVAGTAAGASGGIPWPFLAFGVLISGLRAGAIAARRSGSGRASPFARPLGWATIGVVVGFILGSMLTGAWSGRSGTDRPSPAPSQPLASAAEGAEPPAIVVGASNVFETNAPGLAIDGDPRTSWNAGTSPPAWIELDLGKERIITMVRLLTEQSPAGRTVHRILVASDDGAYTVVHIFDGPTDTGRWLTFRPEAPLERVRAVVVETIESPSWVAWREIVVDGP